MFVRLFCVNSDFFIVATGHIEINLPLSEFSTLHSVYLRFVDTGDADIDTT